MKSDLIVGVVVLDRELSEVQLVVEVKVGKFDWARVERHLEQTMVARACPLALLVTPTKTWLLRDTYEGSGEAAIHVAGEYATSDLLDVDEVPATEIELARRLHDWLEGLAATGHPSRSRSTAREDVATYLVPAVVEGRVLTEMRQ